MGQALQVPATVLCFLGGRRAFLFLIESECRPSRLTRVVCLQKQAVTRDDAGNRIWKLSLSFLSDCVGVGMPMSMRSFFLLM